MADASKILLTGDEKPVYQFAPLKKELAELTTQLLRANHESWHVYFNDRGFHVSEANNDDFLLVNF